MKERQSGVLMHISSLPGKYGIGSFGKSAYDFVDFLVRSKQTYWQILPLGTTSYGDSPYQSFSAFAGNTHFLDFDQFVQEGLLTTEELAGNWGEDATTVDYALIYEKRRPILEKVVQRFLEKEDLTNYYRFVEEKAEWLEPFAEYMAIKESFDMKSWTNWSDEDIKRRHPEALAAYREKLADKLEYHRVTQYLFDKQWKALKQYANEHHIQIIGDMPIYVAEDSVEMWATPHYFKTDEVGNAACVAGCPPDGFSPLGQLWGNPIYNWRAMKLDGFTWWIKRLKASFELFDVVRIDHFRGFAAYWEIPAGATDATGGVWVKGPGFDLFEAVKNELGDLPIIAEDLGFMDDAVIELREATGFPGMKILEFGFMGAQVSSTDLPHYYPVNSVSYTGTHDNDTVLGWYESATDEERDFCNRYLNRTDEPISYAMLRSLYGSVSKMTIATMQDLLQLDTTARMNIPSTLGGNWVWRMQEGDITPEVESFLLEITELYDRSNEQL
ncbi:4-alpha-glucanotransferase [uncultured Granulicatella sp.]|uniref:4-alpha-glucanotransferase n=1 Tax=uncultured Granulicatella sp. TaxID=316089 RepID=UPI0028D3F806|nr:4-alpha-glucanotransferase [uncultured Granulicatella sp.]